MQLPTVHLNGTSGAELFRLNLAVVEHLRDTIDALSKACPNGRDFYTQGPDAHAKAIEEHGWRMERLQQVYAEMQTLVETLADFAESAGPKENRATGKLKGFLQEWFKKGSPSPIHPGTLVNDVETFEEVVGQFIREMR
jgi:hypothetical protein